MVHGLWLIKVGLWLFLPQWGMYPEEQRTKNNEKITKKRFAIVKRKNCNILKQLYSRSPTLLKSASGFNQATTEIIMATTYYSPASTASWQKQDTEALKAIWKTIDAESCPHEYNFHLHTVFSDGQLQPTAIIEQAIALNLKGLAITDHHSVKGYLIANEYLENCRSDALMLPQLWTGVEITSILMGIEVHILGYGFNPNHPVMKPYLKGHAPTGELALAERVIEAIQEAGGLVVLAHPERYRHPAKDLIPTAVALGIDGVETYYAYKNAIPWTPSPKQTAVVKTLSEQYNLLNTCGTDTHGLNLLQRV